MRFSYSSAVTSPLARRRCNACCGVSRERRRCSLGLKVALLTGDAFTMDVIKAMSLGAYDYWVKPIDPHRLIDGVRRALLGKPAQPYPPPGR